MKAALAAIILGGLLTACAPRMQSSVEAFASPDGIGARDRVIVFTAVEPGRETLEHRSWVELVEAQLTRRGVMVTRSPAEATLIAGIDLRIDGGRDVSSTFTIPQWGVTGYSGSNTIGTVNRFGNMATLNAATTYTPQYGITGYQTGSRTDRVFRRMATLIVLRPSSPGSRPQPVFESRAVSEGECGILSPLAPHLVDALFTTFPAGGTRRVTVPIEGRC